MEQKQTRLGWVYKQKTCFLMYKQSFVDSLTRFFLVWRKTRCKGFVLMKGWMIHTICHYIFVNSSLFLFIYLFPFSIFSMNIRISIYILSFHGDQPVCGLQCQIVCKWPHFPRPSPYRNSPCLTVNENTWPKGLPVLQKMSRWRWRKGIQLRETIDAYERVLSNRSLK